MSNSALCLEAALAKGGVLVHTLVHGNHVPLPFRCLLDTPTMSHRRLSERSESLRIRLFGSKLLGILLGLNHQAIQFGRPVLRVFDVSR